MPRPPMELADLDARALYLQVNSIERSTSKNYATGARDTSISVFCTLFHWIPLPPHYLATLHIHLSSLLPDQSISQA